MIETTNNNNDNHKVPLTNEYNVSLSLIINQLTNHLFYIKVLTSKLGIW